MASSASASAAAASASASPDTFPVMAARSAEGVSLFHAATSVHAVASFEPDNAPTCKVHAFSKDGSLYSWCNGKCVVIVETATGKVVREIPRPRTTDIVFSPQNTYICTWENYARKEGEDPNNLKVFHIGTGECEASLINKSHETWQPQWTDDEAFCARNVSNEIQFYKGTSIKDGIVSRAHLKDVAAFAMAPGKGSCKFSAFVPGTKGAPSSVRIYEMPKLDVPVLNKSFYKADKVSMTWNKQGTAVLVSTQTEVDKTGQSYYGETNLHFLSVKGGISVNVQLDKNGPIYDCAWNPNGKEFAVVYGFMPAKVCLFDEKCEPIKDFGTGPRNTVQFSPHGNILAIAGFGNLRGEIEFWARDESKAAAAAASSAAAGGEYKLLNKLHAADSTIFEWCPDSRHIITATTSPRLKVDNCFKVWHYTRGLQCTREYKELLDVRWKPHEYPRRPISPVPQHQREAVVAEKTKQVYRPPGARGAPSSIKLHEEEPAKKTEEMSKAALKNKKKRDAKKAAAAAEGAREAGGLVEKPKTEEHLAAIAMTKALLQDPAPAKVVMLQDPDSSHTDLEKRIRNLAKKLRQIEELKEKRDQGEFVQPNQLEKINSEPQVKEDIAKLEAQLAALKTSN